MVSIAILAGGQSQRMGQDKAFLNVGGRLAIERVIAQVESLTDDLFISANSPEKYKLFGLPIVKDIFPDKVVLGGIYSALESAKYPQVLVVACDMPLLNTALLRYLINLASTAEVIAPLRHEKETRLSKKAESLNLEDAGFYPEVLHTIYHKNCLPALKVCLLANQLRVTDFLAKVAVRYIKPEEIAKIDPWGYSFINMNRIEDWQTVNELILQSPKPWATAHYE